MVDKCVFKRQNSCFTLKLYDDGMVDLVDLEDKETINIKATSLKNLKALIEDMSAYLAENEKGGTK